MFFVQLSVRHSAAQFQLCRFKAVYRTRVVADRIQTNFRKKGYYRTEDREWKKHYRAVLFLQNCKIQKYVHRGGLTVRLGIRWTTTH